jgi:hypothetical protein
MPIGTAVLNMPIGDAFFAGNHFLDGYPVSSAKFCRLTPALAAIPLLDVWLIMKPKERGSPIFCLQGHFKTKTRLGEVSGLAECCFVKNLNQPRRDISVVFIQREQIVCQADHAAASYLKPEIGEYAKMFDRIARVWKEAL